MRTIGKNRGIARLADADGHFRMVALDQRPPLFDAIAQAAHDSLAALYPSQAKLFEKYGVQVKPIYLPRAAGRPALRDRVRPLVGGACAGAGGVEPDGSRGSGEPLRARALRGADRPRELRRVPRAQRGLAPSAAVARTRGTRAMRRSTLASASHSSAPFSGSACGATTCSRPAWARSRTRSSR